MRWLLILMIFIYQNVNANIEVPGVIEYIGSEKIIIIKSKKKLYYNDGDEVLVFPIAIGKSKTPSPTGEFKVARKVINPTWYPPLSIRREDPRLPKKVLPGPKNPLGPRALYISGTLYRIHGTNSPRSIGRAVSHGCFRMRNKDIIKLYSKVDIGTPIYILK
jgi:L,D-transpeptidase ErfK/SrfK